MPVTFTIDGITAPLPSTMHLIGSDLIGLMGGGLAEKAGLRNSSQRNSEAGSAVALPFHWPMPYTLPDPAVITRISGIADMIRISA